MSQLTDVLPGIDRVIHEMRRSVEIRYAASKTWLGWVVIAATERGICLLRFVDRATGLERLVRDEFPNAALRRMDHAQDRDFAAWMRSLNGYLSGRIKQLDLPLDIRGTAFQALVWNYLQTIPAGQVRSYGAVAAAIGKPTAIRAVASACARNRIALAIPCHRVIRGDGGLGGYRWGLGRKRKLLDLERNATTA